MRILAGVTVSGIVPPPANALFSDNFNNASLSKWSPAAWPSVAAPATNRTHCIAWSDCRRPS